MKGKVYMVGAGPGDPELLTLKALRTLQAADVVLHDELVPPEIVRLASRAALVCNVGKRCGPKKITQEEINALMVDYARAGLMVVRLKGGDPLIFGRAAEEMQALRREGVDFEIVPGVTAALAAAAAARISLTDRRRASAVVFLSNHRCAANSPTDWRAVLALDATPVVYMPGENYGGLAAELRAAGLRDVTPCVIVSRAATPEEQIFRTTLGKLPQAPRLPAPAVLVLGAVVEAERSAEDEPDQSEGILVGTAGTAHGKGTRR
jgi:uroporphyrin-III C-methyltransferase